MRIAPNRFSCLLCSGLYAATLMALPAKERPNIILFLADDLGYGDLGCYGNHSVETSHIDQLAREGIRFTDFHSNGPMCTPTRASLMTGLYPQRLGQAFESALNGKRHRHLGLPSTLLTLPEQLLASGYHTAMFGKWHLGYQPPNLPTNHGFQTFIGLTSGDGDHHTHVDRSGNADWWHDEKRVEERGYTADLITQHAIDAIKANRENPFFLYVAHLGIHFPWQRREDPGYRQVGEDYWNDKLGRLETKDVSQYSRSMIESIDDSLGEIVTTIKECGLEENTLLLFLSDNGGYLTYSGGYHNISSNGLLRGEKTELYEGGHRVPCIAWWPGSIAGNQTTSAITMTMDLMPTILSIAQIDRPVGPLDGIDLSDHLLNSVPIKGRTLFWKMDNEAAIRQGVWKLIQNERQQPELFNLQQDLSESHPRDDHPEKLANLQAVLSQWLEETVPDNELPIEDR